MPRRDSPARSGIAAQYHHGSIARKRSRSGQLAPTDTNPEIGTRATANSRCGPVRPSLDATTAAFLTRARAIVLVVDPMADQPPDPTLLRELLRLTLAEARVAALVGTGRPPAEAAAQLGIAEETARTTLKHVFAKVGISRQSELAALLTKFVLR